MILGHTLDSVEKLIHRETDVSCDLSQESRGDITTRVKRDGRATAIRVSILSVGASLPHFNEAARLKQGRNLSGLEDRNSAHDYATRSVWTPMNSDSSFGSPSSRSMRTTSWRLTWSSSSVVP